MRKLLLTLAILLAAIPALAVTHEVKFEWDANTEPDLAGYTLYRAAVSGGPYTAVLDVPAPDTSTLYTISGDYNQTVYFVLTASDTSNNESGFSNEVFYKLPAPPDVTPPAPPSGFRVFLSKIIQAIINFFTGGGLRIG